VSVKEYGWYLAAFCALIVAGIFIVIAAVSLLASLTPLRISLVFSVAAIVLAIVAWLRHPKRESD
jgi:hypothetical protein